MLHVAGWLGVQEELSTAASRASQTADVLKTHREETQTLAEEVKDLEKKLRLLDKVEE